jgi:predicted flap endonuclease-1-like 5' DNA nuclease
MNIPCILIPAFVGLISAILGYLLGKLFSKGGDHTTSLSLQSDLDACRVNSKSLSSKIATLEAELASVKSSISSNANSFVAKTNSNFLFDAALAATVFGKKIKDNDLKIIEGIGPKIEELYHQANIKTWQDLSETPLQKSQSILDTAGESYAIHNPGTWAKQATLAYQGKWQELKDWQDKLDGGKE